MRSKAFRIMAVIIFAFTLWGCASTDMVSDSSQTVVTDPQALVGRWEGSARGLDSSWTSYYALEIFAVDMNRKKVIFRGFCPGCRAAEQWYNDDIPLTVEGGKVFFESFPSQATGWSGIKYEFKGNRISGFARSDTMAGSWRFDYSLKKLPPEKRVFDPKELIGQWVWVSGSSWWELTIAEVDSQNKTFKGKYMIGKSKKEHELSNTKLITEGDKLRIDFKALNDTLHYQLTFYPNFGEYPPVLWGKLERLDGNVSYPMFRKKEKKD